MSFEEVKRADWRAWITHRRANNVSEGLLSRAGSHPGLDDEGDSCEGDPRELTGERNEFWYGPAGALQISNAIVIPPAGPYQNSFLSPVSSRGSPSQESPSSSKPRM